MKAQLRALALAIPLAVPLANAQTTRPVAIVNARILTLEGPTIENGTVLIRGEKIAAVGAEVEVPPGSKVVDARGGTVMPGLVNAWSSAGITGTPRATPQITRGRRGGRGRGRTQRPRGGGSAANQAATKVAPSIYARQDVFGELLESGVTTLAVRPSGLGFPGLAARLDPSATEQADLAVADAAYVVIAPAANSQTKGMIRENYAKAKAVLAERKKPKPAPAEAKPEAEAEKKTEEKAAEKPAEGEKPKEGEKPTEGEKPVEPEAGGAKKRPEPKKDPNIELLADLFDSKQRAFISIGSATELVHYLDAAGEHRFPTVVVAERSQSTQGRLDEVVEELEKLKAPVLMSPAMTTRPYTQTLVNPAAELNAAGIEVGFLIGDSKQEARNLMFELIELVRHGLPAEVALAAITITPAKMLGVDAEVGSIVVGKDADLLMFDGDPLDPTARLISVFHKGRNVSEGKETDR